MSFLDLEDRNEEFNNFMHKVNEISNIVEKLNSKDEKICEIGTLEADRYLQTRNQALYENIDEETVKLTITNDRTMINKKALAREDTDQNTMSQGVHERGVARC
ncbi:hypothetical protein FQR65_LT13464 [Abscondita terminalis]|nr:hypothetical protein FQR65_LT13464 [Abscondita terminalis]